MEEPEINKLQLSDVYTEPENLESTRRRSYENNTKRITKAYVELFNETGDIPTYRAIAKRARVSYQCVSDHIKAIKLDNVVHGHKLRVGPILKALGDKAMTGDPAAVKLWAQLALGWTERTSADIKAIVVKPTLEVEIVKPDAEEIEAEIINETEPSLFALPTS